VLIFSLAKPFWFVSWQRRAIHSAELRKREAMQPAKKWLARGEIDSLTQLKKKHFQKNFSFPFWKRRRILLTTDFGSAG